MRGGVTAGGKRGRELVIYTVFSCACSLLRVRRYTVSVWCSFLGTSRVKQNFHRCEIFLWARDRSNRFIYLFIFFSVEKTVENIFFDGYEEIRLKRIAIASFFFFLRNSQFQLRPLTPHLSPCRFVPITYGCTLQRCFPLIRFLFPFSFFLPRLLCEIGRRATQSRAARNSNYIHIRVHL